MAGIAAALIVRDEARHLPACLGALQDIVDEVVVVDTGSQDSSVEICRSFGATVLQQPWRDDFSQARNTGLDAAGTEWILYIDADERIDLQGDLRQALEDPGIVAARVGFRAASGLTPYLEYRLFRNRADLRFRGAIHETVLPDVHRIVREESARIIDAPIFIEHLGYEGDLTAKHVRNLPLLRKAIKSDPERPYLWHALGEAELALGDAAAAEIAFRQGLAVVRAGEPSPGDALAYSDLLALHFSDDTELMDAAALVDEALERHPSDPLILWWAARQRVAESRWDIACRYLEDLIDRGDPDRPRDLGYDRRLFGEYAWGLLGTIWLIKGQPDKALEYLRQAERSNPEGEEIRAKRLLAEARSERRKIPRDGDTSDGSTGPSVRA